MSQRPILPLVVAFAFLIASCGGGDTETAGTDGVEVFGGPSPVAVSGTRAVDFGDIRLNVEMETDWSVTLNDLWQPSNAATVVLQPVGSVNATPSIAFVRPSSVVEVSALTQDPRTWPEGRTIDLSESFDLESWLAMLPPEIEVSAREPFDLAGMSAVRFEMEVSPDLCDRNCSFLLIERGSAQDRFSSEAIWTGTRNTVIWAEQDVGDLPIIIVIAGDDPAFQQRAQVLAETAVVGEMSAG